MMLLEPEGNITQHARVPLWLLMLGPKIWLVRSMGAEADATWLIDRLGELAGPSRIQRSNASSVEAILNGPDAIMGLAV